MPAASNKLLGWLKTGRIVVRIVVEGNVTLLRREFGLHVTKPSRPQCSNAIDNLVNLFGGIFWLFNRGRHITPNRDGIRGR